MAGPRARNPTPATGDLTGSVRTCVGCRRRGLRSDLVRIVLGSDGRTLVVDLKRSAPGRGAWVHPDPACLDQAVRRRAFPRALRSAGPVDVTGVSSWFGPGTGHDRNREPGTTTVDAESGFTTDGHPMSTQR